MEYCTSLYKINYTKAIEVLSQLFSMTTPYITLKKKKIK